MIVWILYLAIDGYYYETHPFHFTDKAHCEKVGEIMVKTYKYKATRCVRDDLGE